MSETSEHGTRNHKSANSKTPPLWYGKDQDYQLYVKELQMWKEFTSLKPEEMGFAIIFRIEEKKAKEACLTLEIEEIKHANGFDNVLAKLNGLYEKEKDISMYETYSQFEN